MKLSEVNNINEEKGKISTLKKIAEQGGRRGELAHWMANMRSGKKKHNKE